MTEESKTDVLALPPLRDIICDHDLRAEKSLGQNFLLDLNLTAKIARCAKTVSGKTVFEIGPGPGGLTRALLLTDAKNVVAIEFDKRAIAALESLKVAAGGRLDIVHADALKADIVEIGQSFCNIPPYVIAANLPYNIATPLLVGWLSFLHDNENLLSEMVLMFQKEVAQRIVATPSSKTYGRLSILSQWLCDVKLAFDVPPSAFTPPPKITSSIVRFVPKKNAAKGIDFKVMEEITAAAFGQRRKMVRGSLKAYAMHLELCQIDSQKRAEDLSVHDYIKLSKSVTKARL